MFVNRMDSRHLLQSRSAQLGAISLGLLLMFGCSLVVAQQNNTLEIANFDQQGQLIKPTNLDEWVHLGSNMGQGYNEGTFDPASPGTFQIVEMEPSAYSYFKKNGHYADGTMIALSFYRATAKSNPRLNGFSQGELVSFEIHLIDSKKYTDGRAFFNFGNKNTAKMIEAGNNCVKCHREEGAFESTFTQFYPKSQAILKTH